MRRPCRINLACLLRGDQLRTCDLLRLAFRHQLYKHWMFKICYNATLPIPKTHANVAQFYIHSQELPSLAPKYTHFGNIVTKRDTVADDNEVPCLRSFSAGSFIACRVRLGLTNPKSTRAEIDRLGRSCRIAGGWRNFATIYSSALPAAK